VKIVPRSHGYMALLLMFSSVIMFSMVIFIGLCIVHDMMLVYVAVLFLLIPLSLGLYFYTSYRRASRLVNSFVEVIEGLSGDRLILRDHVLLEYGLLETSGKWVSTGRSTSYVVDYDYRSLSEPVSTDTIDLGFYREKGYMVAVAGDAAGYALLPVARIVDERYRDICIVYLGNEMNRLAKRQYTLSARTSYGDSAYAVVNVDNKGFYGNLVLQKTGKARSARLEIWVPGGKSGRRYINMVIARTSDQINFNYPIYPGDQVVIVFPLKFSSPRILAKHLGLKPLIAGFNGVEALLKLIIDIPLHKDVHTEVKLETTK